MKVSLCVFPWRLECFSTCNLLSDMFQVTILCGTGLSQSLPQFPIDSLPSIGLVLMSLFTGCCASWVINQVGMRGVCLWTLLESISLCAGLWQFYTVLITVALKMC